MRQPENPLVIKNVNADVARWTVALTPEDVGRILDQGDILTLAYIPKGAQWQLDLARFGDFPSVTFIGEGTIELSVATDTSGTGYQVRDAVTATLKRGHIYANDNATIDMVGKTVVSCLSGHPLIRADHEWALVQAADRARVVVNKSFQVFLGDEAFAGLTEASTGQMMLQDAAKLVGLHQLSANDLYQQGWKRTEKELQLGEGLTASWHEWLRRQN